MSAPNDVNANVSHSICDFRARHKLSVFDGAPMSPSARRPTNRKSLGRGRPAQRRREPGGRQRRRRSWREEQGMALFVAFSHHNPTAAKPDRGRQPRRACLRRLTLLDLPNREPLRIRADRNLLTPMRRVVPKLCPEPHLPGESATNQLGSTVATLHHNCMHYEAVRA